jgi:hypothetical protein
MPGVDGELGRVRLALKKGTVPSPAVISKSKMLFVLQKIRKHEVFLLGITAPIVSAFGLTPTI